MSDLTIYYGMKFKKSANGYYCNGAFGRYIDFISTKYNKVYLVVPVDDIGEHENINEYRLKSSNIIVQELTSYNGYISALKKARILKKEIKDYSKLWDGSVYIRWPVPLFKYVYKLSIKKKLPVVFHLVGDSKSVISEGSKYKGIIKWIALSYSNYLSILISKYIKKTPTLVNGSGLRRLYKKDNTKVKEIRTSTFLMSEVVDYVKEIDKNNVKLLYVGYLRHEKGLEYLINAVKILVDLNYNITLTIVGDGDILNNLLSLVNKLDISKNIIFKGYIPLGAELYKIYEKNDIFILPSISEGTPRVLIEAMCKGLAVIATNVGGIPFTVNDKINGLLVQPKDEQQIADTIIKLLNDDDLRKNIINEGIEFSKRNTLESHSEEVYTFIESIKKLK
ncbi:MAG: glycosyltransferase family 4 protein [Bacilli bacterium]